MMEQEPVWIGFDLARAIHARQIAEYGVSDGIRDPGLLESALAGEEELATWLRDNSRPASVSDPAGGYG